jgi:hypothetical protein
MTSIIKRPRSSGVGYQNANTQVPAQKSFFASFCSQKEVLPFLP